MVDAKSNVTFEQDNQSVIQGFRLKVENGISAVLKRIVLGAKASRLAFEDGEHAEVRVALFRKKPTQIAYDAAGELDFVAMGADGIVQQDVTSAITNGQALEIKLAHGFEVGNENIWFVLDPIAYRTAVVAPHELLQLETRSVSSRVRSRDGTMSSVDSPRLNLEFLTE